MSVWVVEEGCYDDVRVIGVYASVESAVAAHPIPDGAKSITASSPPPAWHPLGEWLQKGVVVWTNGCNCDHSMTATEWEVSP